MFTQLGDSADTVSTDADEAMHGMPSQVHADIAAKFASGDCGHVKPVLVPASRRRRRARRLPRGARAPPASSRAASA